MRRPPSARRRSRPPARRAPRRCSCWRSRRCRWCAASGCCSSLGVVARASLRADGRGGGARAARRDGAGTHPAARSSAARRASGARRGRACRPAWREAGRAAAREPAHARGLARRARRGGAPPRARARRGLGARGARLGPGHADEGGDRHHQARAAEPQLAGRPQRGPADDRRGRRDRPDGQLEVADQAGDDRMDERVRAAPCSSASATPRRTRLRARRGCARPSRCPTCSRSRPRGADSQRRGESARPRADAGAGERPAGGDPAVLLPGRDHARPPRGDARVRHPLDEPASSSSS